MKIAILTTSLTAGGAAIACARLAEALADLGEDVTVITRGHSRRAFLEERIEIFLQNGFSRKDLFRVSTATFGESVANHPAVVDADGVILGWVNQGFLSLEEIKKIRKPILWVMHDMWNLTGICHYAMGCTRYEQQCGRCRFIHGLMRGDNDLSRRIWRKKQILYDTADITFVGVSNWLAKCARQSSLLAGKDVIVIPNPHKISDYQAPEQRENMVAFGAARLDVPIKGLDIAIDALNLLYDKGVRCKVELFGELRNPLLLDSLKMEHVWHGLLNDPGRIRDIYSRAKVVINPSRLENLPNTLIEGLASGAVPVGFDHDGRADIIDHLSTGYLAKFLSVEDFAAGIEWGLNAAVTPGELHDSAWEKFDAPTVARRYVEAFAKKAKNP